MNGVPVSEAKYEFTPSADSTKNWIGPPDRLSNLRPIIYHIPENESALEKRLRCLRQDTDDWNHKFWTKQNVTFNKEKDDFILAQLKSKGLSERDKTGRKINLTSEEMAVFYKQFLDANRRRHSDYNKEWYRRNFAITVLMSRVAIGSAWTRLSERKSGRKKDTSATDTQ
ncbi:cytochrome c oxidase assembly factor 8 [Aplochiton taeniatus]